jgi:hypothetical protein
MIEAALQILLVLAYFAIALIAVTFPVYAICVVYLKAEKSETGKERKQRLKIVQSKIADLTTKLKGEEDAGNLRKINVEIKRYGIEKKELESGLQSLTARGAVRDPLIYLGVALFASVIGIIFANMEIMIGVIAFGLGSFGSCVLALNSLYGTITRIEHAALRTKRTIDFEICYKSKATMQEVKSGKEEEITIGIKPEEDVENFEARMYVPPEIKVERAPSGQITVQPEGYAFSGYSMITFQRSFLSSASYWGFSFFALASRARDYTLHIDVRGRGLMARSADLILRVKE